MLKLTYSEALEILKSFPVEEGHDWDRHCINVGDIAYEIAKELKGFVPINAEKVRLMGLVHDFGRSVTQCPFRHSYEGYKILKSMGEDELAHICACHSNGTFKPEDIKEYGLKPEDFYVRTLEEKLIFIADNLDCHGAIVRQDIRLADVISRYEKKNPDFVPILKSKIEEFNKFNDEIKNICRKGVYDILNI